MENKLITKEQVYIENIKFNMNLLDHQINFIYNNFIYNYSQTIDKNSVIAINNIYNHLDNFERILNECYPENSFYSNNIKFIKNEFSLLNYLFKNKCLNQIFKTSKENTTVKNISKCFPINYPTYHKIDNNEQEEHVLDKTISEYYILYDELINKNMPIIYSKILNSDKIYFNELYSCFDKILYFLKEEYNHIILNIK